MVSSPWQLYGLDWATTQPLKHRCKPHMALCLWSPLSSDLYLKVCCMLSTLPTSRCVVSRGAGIWGGCWTLVPYPVNAVLVCLGPRTEVILKCAGKIAVRVGSWMWGRKESRVLRVRLRSPFAHVPHGTPASLTCSWPGEDGQLRGNAQGRCLPCPETC